MQYVKSYGSKVRMSRLRTWHLVMDHALLNFHSAEVELSDHFPVIDIAICIITSYFILYTNNHYDI